MLKSLLLILVCLALLGLSARLLYRGLRQPGTQRVLERLEPFKNKVALHERNIEAIQKELAKLR